MRLLKAYDESHLESLRINKRVFFLPHFHSMNSWKVRCQIDSKCQKGPPYSCEMSLNLQINAPSNDFEIIAQVKRTDDGKDCPEGLLSLRLQNMEEKKSGKFLMPFNLKGNEKETYKFKIEDNCYKHLLSERDKFTFPDDMMIIRIRLYILCRHPKTYKWQEQKTSPQPKQNASCQLEMKASCQPEQNISLRQEQLLPARTQEGREDYNSMNRIVPCQPNRIRYWPPSGSDYRPPTRPEYRLLIRPKQNVSRQPEQKASSQPADQNKQQQADQNKKQPADQNKRQSADQNKRQPAYQKKSASGQRGRNTNYRQR